MRVLALLLVFAAVARADEESFYRGAALEREGKLEEAIAELRGIVDKTPADAFADDALLEMARIYDERLGDPLRAAETYERLARAYPESRLATRATRRAAALRTAMGPGAAHARAVAEMNAVLNGFASRPRAESIARMEALLRSDPDFPDAPRATFWLGTTLDGEGRRAESLARFAEVRRRWPGTEWASRAARAEGDAHLAAGELDDAERSYRAMPPGDSQTAGLARLRTARGRTRLATLAWIVLGALSAAALFELWRRARSLRPLVRPPVEVLYLLPVAALFAGAGLTENPALARGIATVCAGGVLVAWLSGAALEAARPVGVARAVAHALAAAAAVACVVWIALTREGLIDFVLETLRFGPER